MDQDTSYFEYDGGQTVLSIAEERTDERRLLRIRGHDLLVCEARYHSSCRKKYTAAPQITLNCFNDNVSVARIINLVPYHFQVVHACVK